MTTHATSASSLKPYRFRSSRAFKAFDDGARQKWVLVVPARDLPRDLPLDANARLPNVIKNPTCAEMRETLLTRPELFQILNGGVVCTATSVGVKQEGNEQWVDVTFDQDQLQGVVNGGHTYGTLLHVVHDHPVYAEGMALKAVLKKDKVADSAELAPLLDDDEKLADRIARARERAMVQLELVAPISDPELLHAIARARNLSQSVDQTALQNLAGKYELMKEVLGGAPPPFGRSFVERVVWKTNQEVPEGSVEVPVKMLIHLLALMNTRLYKPGVKVANEVYMRSGVIIREFGEAEGEDGAFYDKLARLLPEFIKLYDHIYSALPETQPSFPWADGKPPPAQDRKRRKTAFATPLLARTSSSKVSGGFIWPVFSAFRLLLEDDGVGGLHFKTDPIALFEDKKAELSATIQNTFETQGRLVQQVGKATDAWIRLEGQLQMEMLIRERIKMA
jgi:AIPR protein